jgi:hypothetical protein
VVFNNSKSYFNYTSPAVEAKYKAQAALYLSFSQALDLIALILGGLLYLTGFGALSIVNSVQLIYLYHLTTPAPTIDLRSWGQGGAWACLTGTGSFP